MNQKRSCHGRLDPTSLPRFDERMCNNPPLPIEKLPFFGTTWYTRGPAYWFRRALLSLLALLTLYGATAGMVGLFGAIVESKDPITVKVIALSVITLGISFSFVWALQEFFRAERRRRAGQLLRPGVSSQLATQRGRQYGALGAALAVGARGGSLIAGVLFVVSIIFCYGWLVVFFINTLRREYGVEHDARLRLERRLRSRNSRCSAL